MGDCGPNPPTLEVPKEESIAHGIVKRFEQLETQVRFILPVAKIILGKFVCVFYHIPILCECVVRISETHLCASVIAHHTWPTAKSDNVWCQYDFAF